MRIYFSATLGQTCWVTLEQRVNGPRLTFDIDSASVPSSAYVKRVMYVKTDDDCGIALGDAPEWFGSAAGCDSFVVPTVSETFDQDGLSLPLTATTDADGYPCMTIDIDVLLAASGAPDMTGGVFYVEFVDDAGLHSFGTGQIFTCF